MELYMSSWGHHRVPESISTWLRSGFQCLWLCLFAFFFFFGRGMCVCERARKLEANEKQEQQFLGFSQS